MGMFGTEVLLTGLTLRRQVVKGLAELAMSPRYALKVLGIAELAEALLLLLVDALRRLRGRDLALPLPTTTDPVVSLC